MSASEPTMDAVEKVARALHAADCAQFGTDISGWDAQLSAARNYYYANAEHLLAAFPQLALEGREEWANAWGKQPIQAVLEKHARDAKDSYGVPLLKRTFWEQPWSEVRS